MPPYIDSSVIWDITPSGLLEIILLYAGFFLGLFFGPEVGDMFLLNVC
jgi:hypothetical protein